MRANTSPALALESTGIASDQTANCLLDGTVPFDGSVGICIASPPGASARITQVLPLPCGRVEVKSRWVASGVHRGLLLSYPGDVQRCGALPSSAATHTS